MLWAQTWFSSCTATLLLAVVAAFGYILGRRRTDATADTRAKTKQEILRALSVAQELEGIAYRLRKSLSCHVPAIVKFDARLKRMESTNDVSWQELCTRVDELLKPALRMSTEVSHAYNELIQQMNHLAAFAELRTDPLTGIYNRRAFDESLEACLAQQARYPFPVTLMMIDIDHFKQINDRHGHLEGDRMLQELGQLLKATARECDVVARFGGEEFVILLPHTDLPAACNLAERLRIQVQTHLPLTISLGIASSREGDGPRQFIERADAALYKAKHSGRNRVCLHEGPCGRLVLIKGAGPDPAASQHLLGEPAEFASDTADPSADELSASGSLAASLAD